MTLKTIEMDFEYMNYIEEPPRSSGDMFKQCCSADGVTVDKWRDIWLGNTRSNHAKFGGFCDKGIGKLWGKFARQPGICAGSGPSLKENGPLLKDTKGIPVISCLHNFHFFVDNELRCDYFVSLDAGEVTIEEISEGGMKTQEEYFEATKNYTLLAFVGSSPKLLEIWKGEILFFNCAVPDQRYMEELSTIEKFGKWVSTGGNVLGAVTYIVKSILGCNPIAFIGADFAFSYKKQFHGWTSKYDIHLGHVLRGIDVWGNKVLTWQSYFNFKLYFEWLAMTVPGIYINCTEGGTLGSYPEGNMRQITQMSLERFIRMYSLHTDMEFQCKNPEAFETKLLY